MVFKMEKLILLVVFCGLAISVLNAEFTAENVYDYLSRRLDRLSFKIGIIQNEMTKQSSTVNDDQNDSVSINKIQIKNMFDDFKREINTKFVLIEEEISLQVDMKFAALEEQFAQKMDMKFANLEETVAQKVDMKFADLEERFEQKVDIYRKEKLSSVLYNTIRQNKKGFKNKRDHLKKHLFNVQKSLSAEKRIIRNSITIFQDRVEDVERKMFAFENASWKGEKGNAGNPGATGPTGMKGSKGEKGLKGETSYRGTEGGTVYKGSGEKKMLNGSPETRNNLKTQIRLAGGNSQRTGRLEIFFNGKWDTVYEISYPTNFNNRDASVVCRMLEAGESGTAFVFPDGPGLFGEGIGFVLTHGFNCNGNETDLSQCVSMSSWRASETYGHSHDVAVSCEKTKLRLVDGDTPQSGRVEVFMKGYWSSICSIDFDDDDARAICNILGYKDSGTAKSFTGSHYGQGSGKIIISHLNCFGTESDIKYCSPRWNNNECNHRNDAGVICDRTLIRLANGPNNSSGRVEIYHGGHWGTICGSKFDQNDVMIICKMLGINNPNAFGYPYSFYGNGDSNIIVRNLNCDGSESDIAQCKADAWSVSTDYNSCGFENEASVNCGGKTTIRLVNGDSEQSGRVEVYHNGNWGTISDRKFDNHDLAVICNMLGYQYTSKSFFTSNSFYGQGMGEVVVSDLQCTGAEDDIGQCQATWWPKTSSIGHENDVGVSCDGNISVKLLDGNTNASGRVGIYHSGHFGTICSRKFDRLDLAVVCRMLGFENIPQSAYWHTATSHGQGIGEIVVSDLTCSGIEHSIGQCGGNWPVHGRCDHSEDVYVNCDGASEKIKLVNGHSHFSGRVEIFMFGQWATICDKSFDRADAVVICRMLNFPHPEKAIAHKGAHYGAADDAVPILLKDLNCNGLEQNLGQCHPTWDNSYCRHSMDIGVDCCPDCQYPVDG